MSKFPKHWKIKKSKVGDGLTQSVTMQISAYLMPDGTQSKTFRSTCCLSTGEVPAPWLRQAQELWHTVIIRVISPSLTEDTEAQKLPHIQDFLVFCKDLKNKIKQSPTFTSYSVRLFCQLLDYNITFLNSCTGPQRIKAAVLDWSTV